MKYCPKCMIDLTDSDRFCRSCGGPVADRPVVDQPVVAQAQTATDSQARCPNCGAAAKPGWKACNQCGFQLQGAQPVAQSDLQTVPVDRPATPAPQGSLVSCLVCGKANRSGMRFCEGCGQMLESQPPRPSPPVGAGVAPAVDPDVTRRSVRDPGVGVAGGITGGIPAAGMGSGGRPAAFMGGQGLSAAAQAPALMPCGKCGAQMRPGLNFCEVCGTPAGYIEEPREPRSYKWLIATGIVILVLAGAAAGYHFWGVKMTIDVTSNPSGEARVYLDGESLGSTQGRLVVNHVLRGEHTIRVERDGFNSQTRSIKIGLLDFTSTVPVEMSRTAYTLTIRNTPNDPSVKMLLEDKSDAASGQKPVGAWDAAKSAFVITDVFKGESYTITLKRAGYRDYKEDVTKLSDNKDIRPDWVISMAGEWSGSYLDNSGTTPLETRFTLTLADSGPATSSTSSARFTGTLQEIVSYAISEATISPSSRYVSFKVVKGENTYTFYGYLGADLMKLQDGSWYVSGTTYGSGSWSMSRSLTSSR